jgi:hypothetical protein
VAQASDDVLFEEDIAPDEEPLEWEATDEGIEISLDCTKCAAYQPFTLTWEEILALGAGRKVKNFSRVGSSLHYRHTCSHCLGNYRQAEYPEKDAKREATSTLIIGLAEFDQWNRQALGREKAAGKQRRYQQQQPAQPAQQPAQRQAPAQQPVQRPAPQQPAQQPAQPAQPQQQPRARTPRVQLTAADKRQIQQYVRQLAQQGYAKPQIIAARREFAKELLQTRREEAALVAEEQRLLAQQQQAQQQRPRQHAPQTPVVQQATQYRKARTRDGRLVLVNAAGQIVKYLS